MANNVFGAIEAGGTKFVCAIGTNSGSIIHSIRIPTRAPAETMADVIAFFQNCGRPISAFGIGSFGPIDLNPASSTYGFITSTPKESWRNFDLAGTIRRAFNLPVAFDTDVNAAILGESQWGAAQGLETALYVTVGTGIGGGAIVTGKPLHGLVHPEMGHIRIPHDFAHDPFPGLCPYHGDCLEGLASGPAIKARWGIAASELPADHTAFNLEADYLASACVNWICTLSPQRLILGGGVMQPHIFPLLRERTRSLLNDYVNAPEITERIDHYIVPPALGNQAGVLGGLALAISAMEKADYRT
ncbi:MAG TPA: ROK family protein [Candidatus Angelobacter sp.]|nr:ROK family protein [Candidatus Angelobacter sp.]